MKNNMNELDWNQYRMANEEHISYKIALLNAIPLVNEKGEEKLIQIDSEDFRRFIAHLIQQGRFVEAKDIFELSKKVSQKDIERELYTVTPLSLRLGYPYYLKVMMKALKEKTSASAILRRIIIEEVNNLIEELSNIPSINKELLNNIKKQANNLITSVKEKEREQCLFEWDSNSLDSRSMHYFNEFIYDAIIAGLQKEGLNPEIFKLMMPEKPKNPYLSITGKIVHKAEADQFVLRIQFGVGLDSWDWEYYLYEYPILVLEKFGPEEILKFHQATGSPGFKNMSISEVRELKEKAGKIPRDELVEAVFRNDSLSFFGNILNILAVYSEYPEDSVIYEFVDEWEFTFIPKILSIELPIKLHQNEVVTADASIPLRDFKKVSRYVFNVYKERFDIKDILPSDLVLINLNPGETEKTLWMLAFKEATLRVSEVIAKLIAESLPSSDVIKTSVPRAFPKLLEAFRRKKLRKILEEKIEGMTI